jgi:hypothetical protein
MLGINRRVGDALMIDEAVREELWPNGSEEADIATNEDDEAVRGSPFVVTPTPGPLTPKAKMA